MPEAGADVWMRQADSDRRAAIRVFDPRDARTFCQAVAKQQQAVEKAIKALASAARDARLATVTIKFSHGVDKLINALRRLHRPAEAATIQSRIDRLLDGNWVNEINALMELAPHRPASSDQLVSLNTEYPYQLPEGIWRAPADEGAFDQPAVRRFQVLADHMVFGCQRIVLAIERQP